MAISTAPTWPGRLGIAENRPLSASAPPWWCFHPPRRPPWPCGKHGDLRAEALVVRILKKSPKFGPCSAFKSAPRKLLEVFIVRPVVAPATGRYDADSYEVRTGHRRRDDDMGTGRVFGNRFTRISPHGRDQEVPDFRTAHGPGACRVLGMCV